MLVLGRQVDETIVIEGGRITITVCDIRGDRVRLGITADRSIRVDRGEVHQAILRDARRKERV